MHKFASHTSILAIGSGTFLYCYHQKRKLFKTVVADVSKSNAPCPSKEESESYVNIPVLPGEEIPEGPLLLSLCQVQVTFRHGARTPLHVIPKIEEAEFDPQFISREHQSTVFPYQRVSSVTNKPIGWSNYEKKLTSKLLRGGACYGALTSYGKDQMYQLGRTLRACYRDKLALCNYNPQDVIVKSSNIKRTVESAACVLAGLYTKNQLQQFAERNEPVKIFIPNEHYNILVPDTTNCEVLRKVNHSALLHPDFIPGMKEDRLKVEKHLAQIRQNRLECVEQVQAKINRYFEFENSLERTSEMNQFNQSYEHDPVLYPLFQERNYAILKINQFWYSVMLRHPVLNEFFKEEDYNVLAYLCGMEAEEFQGKFASGYRIHFYFDSNPYFYNKHLCKEVSYSGETISAKNISIAWKPQAENKEQPSCFFDWYTQKTTDKKDDIGFALCDIYINPLVNLELPAKYRDRGDLPLNFVFCKDDITSRLAQGWKHPAELEMYQKMIQNNATKLLYYAMTGQHDLERLTVTRLSAGPLLTEMVNSAEQFISGKSQYKMCLYSSHDSTLIALLEALGIWDGNWPPFASDVRLELHKELDRDQFYVRILYQGKVQRIRGQEEDFIHWTAFKRAISKYMIKEEEYAKICASNILEKIAKDILKHEEKEVVTKELQEQEATPAGM
uniref:Uncharacterized protein n=1 Tax=Biomphalaria glabrata TaxID=6526 RepID=A0A2C9KSZ8_BIOGL